MERYDIHSLQAIPTGNVAEPPQSIQLLEEHSYSGEILICYLGRVTFQKVPEYFIVAASKVLKKDKRFRFVMAVEGNLLNKMIEMTARLRISNRFHFTGLVKEHQVARLLSISDALVMPSVAEPFGKTLREAMQHRIPAIISKQADVQESFSHVFKVDFWNTEALSNALYGIGVYRGIARILANGKT